MHSKLRLFTHFHADRSLLVEDMLNLGREVETEKGGIKIWREKREEDNLTLVSHALVGGKTVLSVYHTILCTLQSLGKCAVSSMGKTIEAVKKMGVKFGQTFLGLCFKKISTVSFFYTLQTSART